MPAIVIKIRPTVERSVQIIATVTNAKTPLIAVGLEYIGFSIIGWLRGLDLNQRPSGYEARTSLNNSTT